MFLLKFAFELILIPLSNKNIFLNHELQIHESRTMHSTHYLILILALMALAAACSETTTKDIQKDIQGDWELYSAERDGKNIATLEGTYFNFTGDTLISNFPTTPKIPYTVPIKITSNTITNLEQEVVFIVEPENYTDTLHLSTMFKGNGFDLMLRRVDSQ